MRKISRYPFATLGLIVGLGLSLAGAATTAADTHLTQSGVFGVHFLADSAEYAGVRCTYDNASTISAIRVRDPFVFARSRTSGVDTQWVSWYFRIQAQTPGDTTWTSVATSPVSKKTATDAQVANFSPITKTFAGTAAKQYRVLVVIRWYGQDGTTEVGRATHRPDWYSWEGVPSFEGLCPGGLF
ncbi:MAG: hypothetical protein H0V73_05415 [Chloroflexi bacterium]|nr:hypothetical protein [Chloroflexota bacterium]